MNGQQKSGYPAWAQHSPYFKDAEPQDKSSRSKRTSGSLSLGGGFFKKLLGEREEPGFQPVIPTPDLIRPRSRNADKPQHYGFGSTKTTLPAEDRLKGSLFDRFRDYQDSVRGPSGEKDTMASTWHNRSSGVNGYENFHEASNLEYYGSGHGHLDPWDHRKPTVGNQNRTRPPYAHAPPLGRPRLGEGQNRWSFQADDHFLRQPDFGPSHYRSSSFGQPQDRVVDPFLDKLDQDLLKISRFLARDLSPNAVSSQQPHFVWNMLSPPNTCRIPGGSNASSLVALREPATWPRLSRIKIVCSRYPKDWEIDVIANDQFIGVTCGDIISTIYADIHELAGSEAYHAAEYARQKEIGETYRQNRAKRKDLGQGMRRLDFLGQDIIFGGLVDDPKAVKNAIGRAVPGMFLLVTNRLP